jgi:DNA mismatch repair protein MutS2
MRARAADVEDIEKQKAEQTRKKAFTTEAQRAQRLTETDLHVRGMRVEEALERADKFLDEAVLAGHAEVRIVHGIGTGALKKALTEFLAAHPHVESSREAEREHGGAGAMVITLRKSE